MVQKVINVYKAKKQTKMPYWDHKEATTRALIVLGVPSVASELAVVDLAGMFATCYNDNLNPTETAGMIYDECRRIYTNDAGDWYSTVTSLE